MRACVYAVLALLLASERSFSQGVLTTIAGTDWLFPADGRRATDAPLNAGLGLDIAADASGNFYICDEGNEMVMRVGRDGIIHVVAGNGIAFPSGDGQLAVNAGLLSPLSVALDNLGNLYIGQYGGQIRKVSPDGIITNIAGKPESGFSGDGGPAAQAQMYGIYGLVVDKIGNIYVADTYNQRVRRITPDGTIQTFAGGGTSSADGVPATSARLVQPQRLALDAAGNLYIADLFDNRVRMVAPNGIITTAAGGGFSFADGIPATSAAILPAGIAVDPEGNLLIADLFTASVRRVGADRTVLTLAGSGTEGYAGDGGPAKAASFRFGPAASIAATASTVYVGDDGNGRIRGVSSSGTVDTVAGNGLFHFSGNNGAGTSATLDNPTGVTGDAQGNVYFTEPFANRIRRIAPDGRITVIAGTGTRGYSGDGGPAVSAALGVPQYITVSSDGSIVFSDAVNCVIRAIDPGGTIRTIAGSGRCAFTGDLRNAKETGFAAPSGVDFDGDGDLLIADTENNRIRAVIGGGSSAGQVITLAGDGTAGYSGDGGVAINNKSRVNKPTGLRMHGNGLYFCDTGNNVVRYIDFTTFEITTVAGNGTDSFSGDGGPAVKAGLKIPSGLAFDAAGNMYIADTGNSRIRKVDLTGTITTYAGATPATAIGDGLPPLEAFIGGPRDLFIRSNGNMIFTDIYYQRVREILNLPPAWSLNPSSLALTGVAGAPPTEQDIRVDSAITGVPYIASVDSAPWLKTSVASGRTPGTVHVTADPSSLAAGAYSGTITLTSASATPPAIAVPVTFTVSAAGQPGLGVSPLSLTFPYVQGAGAVSRPISVTNTGGGSLPFQVTVQTTSGGPWLRASTEGGVLQPFGSIPVNITTDAGQLSPGTWSGTVTITSESPAQTVVVPVTMTVSAVLQTILLPQTGLSFYGVQGGGVPPPQNINILNAGSGQMPWSVTTSTVTGGTWLSAFPQSGQTDAGSPIVPQVRVNVNPTGLNAGTYFGTVQVSSPGATNQSQLVSIVFSVLPPGSNLGPIVQPSGIIFSTLQGDEPPAAQNVVLQGTTSSPVSFSTGVITEGGVDWLKLAPAAGTITASEPARIVLQPDTQKLSAGIYRASLTLSFSDGTSRVVSLLLVVVPRVSSAPGLTRRDSAADAAACKPTTLAPIITGLSAGPHLRVGWPDVVEVRVIDDCGTPMTSGGVTTTFSNGDPPLRLTSVKNGSWIATWVVGRAASQVIVKAVATIPELKLTGQTQLTVSAQATTEAPVITQDGVVNAASFSRSGPLAPGSIVAVFGSQLAQDTSVATNFPLPLLLAGSRLVLGGKDAPLFFASDGQVNAVVPYGIPVNTQLQAVASRASGISVPQTVTLAAAAPGIFTLDGKQGVVVAIDAAGRQTLVDATHPARVGNSIVIYCTGLGEVQPPVNTGDPAPAQPLARVVSPVSVSIGGVEARVLFAGLTPTQVGLYQINAVVAEGTPTGLEVPLTVAAAGQVSASVTLNVQ